MAPILHAKIGPASDKFTGHRKKAAVKVDSLHLASDEVVKTATNLVVEGLLKVQELSPAEQVGINCLEEALANPAQTILSSRSEVGLPNQEPLARSGKWMQPRWTLFHKKASSFSAQSA